MEKRIKRFYNFLTVADKYTGNLKQIYFFIKKMPFKKYMNIYQIQVSVNQKEEK